MKELKLNPDGILNIIDPKKYFICTINISGPTYWQCVKMDINEWNQTELYGFSAIYESNSWMLRSRSVGFSLFVQKYIQYSCQTCLEFFKQYPGHEGKLYQFDSLQEFICCHLRGEI